MLHCLILVNALFLLDGGRRREWKKKKKELRGGIGFPGAGPALLAMPQVDAVRYN
jgi:hypothetical protein